MSPWKLQNPTRVDAFRQSVGLEPLSEKTERVRQGMEGAVPPDFKQKQQEMEIWSKAVGWLRN